MNCTHCQGTGFLNYDQVDLETRVQAESSGNVNVVLDWIERNPDTDAQRCDCCGDGESWYGEPGQHYGLDDPSGLQGPYASNGGLCKCH